MFKLIFADIRKNLKLFIGTFIAIAVATGIITACLNLVFSATANFSDGNRFSNVNTVLTSSGKIILETVDDDGDIEIEKESVEGRIPIRQNQIDKLKLKYNIIEDYTFHIETDGLISKKIAGHNYSSKDLTGFDIIGSAPNNTQIVVDENFAELNNLQIGDYVEVFSNTDKSKYQISAIAYSTGAEDFELQNYIFFSDEVAKANANGCQSIAILDDNIDINDFNEDEFEVFIGKDTNKAEISSIVSNDISLMVIFITMGSVCLVISLFVISGTMQFSIKNRYRLISQLRVIGMKKSQVSALLSFQTAVISLFGATLGAILSIHLADYITKMYLKMGIVSSDFKAIFSPFWALVVIVAIIFISIVVTNITASKSLSKSPASAMKSEGDVIGKTSIAVLILGVIFVLGGIAILIFTPMTQGIGIGMVFCASTVLLSGAICLMPIIVRFFNVILSLNIKSASKSLGQVAYGNIKMKASKFAVASVSIAIMMSMSTVMVLSNDVYIDTSIQHQYQFANDYKYVSGGKFDYQIEDNTNIFSVKNTSFLLAQGDELNDYNVLSVLGDTPKLNFIEKTNEVNSNYVWVSEDIKKVKIGDEIIVYLENGQKSTFVIGGIFSSKGITDENYSFVVDYNSIKHSLYNEKLSVVYSEEKVFEDSQLHDLNYYKNSISFDIQQAASILLGMIGLALSVVALFNTFFVIMSVRTSEFNKLKLIGAKKHQIFKMAFIEIIIVTLTGMIIGGLVIAGCVGTYSYVNAGVFDFIVNKTIFFGMIIITAFLSLISGLLPSIMTISAIKRQFRNE